MANLPPLNWRKLPRQTVGVVSNPPVEILNSIATVLGSGQTTWYNGEDRTVTPSPDVRVINVTSHDAPTQAVSFEFQTPSPKTIKGIIAGEQGISSGPPMASPDGTPGTREMVCALGIDAGAYLDWHNAAYFTSGRTSNYWKWALTTINTWQYDLYECQEALCIVMMPAAAATNPYAFMLGAWLDPLDPTGLSGAAESDGRSYGIISGRGGVSSDFVNITEYRSGNNINRFGDTHTSTDTNHAGIVQHRVGTAGMWWLDRGHHYTYPASDGNVMRTRSGKNVLSTGMPWVYYDDGGFARHHYMGVSREFGVCPRNVIGAQFQSGGVDVAYVWLNYSWTDPQNAWALAY